MKRVVMAICMLALMTGCSKTTTGWRAEHLGTTSGFKVPECALPSAGRDVVYVSNIECKPGDYWVDDSMGFVSVVGINGKIQQARWVNSEKDMILHSPKGMCLLGGLLYFADNSRLMRCTEDGKNVEIVASGFVNANDLCTDGRSVWVSDTKAGKVYRVAKDGKKRAIKAPAGVNGITFSGEKLYAVSWDLHEVYELDPSGSKDPVAFGLAENFVNLDGIEVLSDGTFLVSDFKGDAVYLVSADRERVEKFIAVPTPADIGIDRERGLLYVPQFMKDKLSVYRITKP